MRGNVHLHVTMRMLEYEEDAAEESRIDIQGQIEKLRRSMVHVNGSHYIHRTRTHTPQRTCNSRLQLRSITYCVPEINRTIL